MLLAEISCPTGIELEKKRAQYGLRRNSHAPRHSFQRRADWATSEEDNMKVPRVILSVLHAVIVVHSTTVAQGVVTCYTNETSWDDAVTNVESMASALWGGL